MGVRRLGLLLAVLLIPTGARAGDHIWDMFISPYGSVVNGQGASGSPSSNRGGLSLNGSPSDGDAKLLGWHVATAFTLKDRPNFSFIADVSFHSLKVAGDRDLTQATVMAGPRYTFGSKKEHTPFIHAMVLGFVYRSDDTMKVRLLEHALALGIGHEVVPPTSGKYGVRVQLDWIVPFRKSPVTNLRLSVGGIWRFGAHPHDESRQKPPEKEG